jgi:hypothetical protein
METPAGAVVAHCAYRPYEVCRAVVISSEPPEPDDPQASFPVQEVVSPFVDHENAPPATL